MTVLGDLYYLNLQPLPHYTTTVTTTQLHIPLHNSIYQNKTTLTIPQLHLPLHNYTYHTTTTQLHLPWHNYT